MGDVAKIAADLLKFVLNTKRAKHLDNAELDELSRAPLKIVEKLLTDVGPTGPEG